uniref:Uncharacterized protein n=1 Tax=Rhizophora mucronata TaxID=61149 RepID=A0A2P2N5G3_RHIMU
MASSCKSSCRLFGFLLTEDRQVTNEEINTPPITSPLTPRSSFLPHVDEQFHRKAQAMVKCSWKQLC